MNYRKPKILIVDNYDSFTYNLVQIIREHGKCDFVVKKNDRIEVGEAVEFDSFLFSPGPGTPGESKIMSDLLKTYCREKSFLGICLGHQAIGQYYGMKLERLRKVRHGEKVAIRILDPEDYIFRGLPHEIFAGLYNSLGIYYDDTVKLLDLRVTALGSDGVVMAVSHTRYDIKGLQFHPESYMTENGALIIKNWINHLIERQSNSLPKKH